MSAPFVDCMSCVVTERANSSCEVTITYPAPGASVNDIQPMTTVNCDCGGGASNAFVLTSVSKPINGIITAHGEVQFLALAGNAVCRGYRGIRVAEGEQQQYMAYPTRGMTLSKLIRYLNSELSIVGASVSTDLVEGDEEPGDGSYIWEFDAPTTARQIMSEAAKLYGGIWEYSGMSATLSGRRGQGTSLAVTFGDNALSQTVVYDFSEQYTHVCPFWTGDDYITGQSFQSNQMEKITVYCNAVYVSTGFSGAFKPYMLDCSEMFKVKPDSQALETAATTFIAMSNSELGGNTVGAEDIKFVDLSKTLEGGVRSDIAIGGGVTVSTRYGDSVSGTCVGISYDSVRDRYVSLEVASNDSATRGRKSRSRSAGGGSNRSSRKLTGFSIAELRGKIADLEYAVKHPKQVFPKKVERVSANEVYAIYDGYRETWYADGTGDERHNIRKVVTLEEQT